MTHALIARHFEITVNTLKKHASDALAEGKELHEGVLLSRMAQLGRQDSHPATAFNATRWQLATLHGYTDDAADAGAGVDEAEQHAAALEEARAKLAPYLAVSNARKAARQIEGKAKDVTRE